MLPDIVSADQTAYVKGRNITQNIRIIQDAIEYTKQKKMQKILLFLDFEKAFDSVEHNFIFKTLGKFNFGPDIAGLKLNIDKAEGMGIGTYKDTEGTIHGVNFKTTPVKFLGIYVGNDPEKCKEKNWDGKIKKIKTTLLLWKRRDLTIFGKITIIKSLVLPIITFTSHSTCVPPAAVKHIHRIFFDFI